MSPRIQDSTDQRKRNFTAERRKVLRDACSDPRVTDYWFRLFSAIANRIDVSGDGRTRPVSHTTLANESGGKNKYSSIAGCKALKRLGYIDWQKEPNPKTKGRARHVYWLTASQQPTENRPQTVPNIETKVNGHSPVQVNGHSPDFHEEDSSRDIDIDAVRADARPRPRRPKPFHAWGPSNQDLMWAREVKGYSNQRIREVHESLRRWAHDKNMHLSKSKWSEVWCNSFARQDAYDEGEAAYDAWIREIIK